MKKELEVTGFFKQKQKMKTHHNFIVSLDLETYNKLKQLAVAMNRPVKNQAEWLISQCLTETTNAKENGTSKTNND